MSPPIGTATPESGSAPPEDARAAPSGLFGALRQWRRRPDTAFVALAFLAMLATSGAMLAEDFGLMPPGLFEDADERRVLSDPDLGPDTDAPSDTPLAPARPGSRDAPQVSPDRALAKGMTFELLGDGRLMATGSITPGTAATFAAEIEKRGSYVRTVVLRSPGGSVRDALAMGRLIRQKGFATQVPDGAYCASSCPLVFAGGVERRAGRKAAIGVHQVYTSEKAGSERRVSEGMATAQRISAECQRYLSDMGVDLGVWTHAMETPSDKLFYFTPEEMARLKLTTSPAAATPPAPPAGG